jgi:phosphoribosylformimino-5-aminoimidazole carboxamide ribotide isomerase
MMIIIPAIDMKDGNCVRLFQGDFDQQTQYSNNPASIARKFQSMNFTRLHIVDLDGARSGLQKNHDFVRQIAAETDFEIQLGGGIRKAETIRSWLGAGVSRCVIGSAAITGPESVKAWLEEFGSANIVLALDVRLDERATPFLATDGWTKITDQTLWQCVDNFSAIGLNHVLCTDISRDGAMSGPNIDLYRKFVQRYPDIALQASGGVRNIQDLEELRDAGAASAIIGKALLDRRISKEEIASFQRGA